MKLNPQISLAFNGQCEAAFGCYEQCLNGTIAFMLTWGNSPMAGEAPPGWDAKIYHATLKIGDAVVMGGDLPPNRYEQPKGFSLVLQMDDSVAAERAFQALAENGITLDRMLDAHRELKTIDARAYLELHIEQGPVLESMNKPRARANDKNIPVSTTTLSMIHLPKGATGIPKVMIKRASIPGTK